jgi:HEAT repeat protein
MNVNKKHILHGSGVLIFCLLFLIGAGVAQEGSESKFPVAFPEETADSPVADFGGTIPAPVAIPPGKTETPPSIPSVPEAPSASADWVLRRMATSEDAEVRRRASEAWPVSDSFMDAMNTLVYALADPDQKVRAAAVDRLHRMEQFQVFGYVMRTMVAGTADRVRALDGALPALEAALAPLMEETLRTEIEAAEHRRIAAYCLGRMGGDGAVDTLGHYAAGNDMTLSRACADALYAIGTPRTIPHWMTLLEHQDLYCRRLAALGLAFLGGPNAFERLRLLILDGNEEVSLQTDALQALQDHPPMSLYPLLVEVLEQNLQVRPVALRILRARAGVDYGANMEAWREWLHSLTAVTVSPIVPSQ